jgi:DNA-binding winged helix-turn-helix (wHTH) protein/TolB-like protein/Flp pilus assembly protein TadD
LETLATRTFRFSDFELDGVKRRLSRNGQTLLLTPKAFDLLLTLVEFRGEVLSKDDLLARVWPGQFVEEGNLKVHISALRKVFGEGKGDHRFIVTVPGRGYSFVADLDDRTTSEVVVERHSYSNIVVEDTGALPAGSITVDEDGVTRFSPAAGISSTFLSRGLVISLSVFAIAAVAVAYWFFIREAPVSKPITSVAVMPFSNESGNPDLEYLSDGLTESLIGSLAQLPELSVKARTSIFGYKGKEIDLRRVGTDLGVDALLTGRLVQRGDKLELYIEFVDPVSGTIIWRSAYRRSIKDIAALEADISRDVAKNLKAKLSGEETVRLEKYQTDNSDAYELYLRGVHFSRAGSTLERLIKSIECYEQAIALDPNYALAYVGLAWNYMRLGTVYGFKPPHETYPKAREALIKALSIDDELASAHGAMAEYYISYERNWPAAEREFERAIALDPEDPGVLAEFGNYYDTLNRLDDAVRMREKARRLLPTAAAMVAGIGHSFYYAGRYEEAIGYYRKALELNPQHAWSHHGLGRSYLETQKFEEGVAEIEKAAELFDRSPRSLSILGNAYAVTGKPEAARRILAELKTRAESEFVGSYYLAVVYAGLDDRDRTFEYLEKALTEHQSQLIRFKVEPLFKKLRGEPRFGDLVKKLGIPE